MEYKKAPRSFVRFGALTQLCMTPPGEKERGSERDIEARTNASRIKWREKAMLKNDFYRSVPRCVVERRIEGKTEEVGKARVSKVSLRCHNHIGCVLKAW